MSEKPKSPKRIPSKVVGCFKCSKCGNNYNMVSYPNGCPVCSSPIINKISCGEQNGDSLSTKTAEEVAEEINEFYYELAPDFINDTSIQAIADILREWGKIICDKCWNSSVQMKCDQLQSRLEEAEKRSEMLLDVLNDVSMKLGYEDEEYYQIKEFVDGCIKDDYDNQHPQSDKE